MDRTTAHGWTEESKKLELSRRMEREIGYFRLACALICIIASTWLLLTATGGIGFSVGVIGLLAAIGWVFSFRIIQRRTQSANHWLELTQEGLYWQHGGKAQEIDWGEIIDIDVDEEKLLVRVHCLTGESISIPPSYGNLGVYGLMDRIKSAWHEIKSTEGVMDGKNSPKIKPVAR